MGILQNVTELTIPEKIMNTTEIKFSVPGINYLYMLFLALNFAEITADVLILYIVLKHKFWKVSTYSLILNWTILDIIQLFTSPVIATAVLRFLLNPAYVYVIVNVSVNSACFLARTIILLIMMLSQGRLFKVHFVKFVVFAWVVAVTLCIFFMYSQFSISNSGKQPLDLTTLLVALYIMQKRLIGLFLPCLLIVLIACFIYLILKSYLSNTYAKITLVLVTTYICYWLIPVLILIAASLYEFYFHVKVPPELILLFVLLETNAIANLYILQLKDEHFKRHLTNLFCCNRIKCKRRDINVFRNCKL